MKDNKDQHYYTELNAKGFKYTNKFSGFDSACAHFSTCAKVGTIAFEEAKQDGIKFTGDQEVSHGWVDYTVGKTFVQDGWEKVSPMSPEWEYRTAATMSNPVYTEVL
jgi:hypothetical protein